MIRQREQNIVSAGELKELMEVVVNKEKDWKEQVKNAEENFAEDIIETLNIVGKAKGTKSQNYQDAIKLLNARINNLESNLHIEIDMERIEDRSKALSYIGIEIADALKSIPTPMEEIQTTTVEENEVTTDQTVTVQQEEQQYTEMTTFETKPTLWQRIKNSKVVKAIKAITRMRIVFDYSDALPEGRGENQN